MFDFNKPTIHQKGPSQATVYYKSDAVEIAWIETKESERNKGYGSALLDEILASLEEGQNLTIKNIAPEAEHFYRKYVKKKFNISDEMFNDSLDDNDIYTSLIINSNMLTKNKRVSLKN